MFVLLLPDQATAGDTHLGGEDFDNRLVNFFVQVWPSCISQALVLSACTCIYCVQALVSTARYCPAQGARWTSSVLLDLDISRGVCLVTNVPVCVTSCTQLGFSDSVL